MNNRSEFLNRRARESILRRCEAVGLRQFLVPEEIIYALGKVLGEDLRIPEEAIPEILDALSRELEATPNPKWTP